MKDDLRRVLDLYSPSDVDEAGLLESAVVLLLYQHEERIHVVLQKRSEHVEHHKGQISLPGGAMDPDDPDLIFTALREVEEEMGVDPALVEILGRIDQVRTGTSFRITPYVAWLNQYPYEWRFPEVEVAYLLEVPIDHLLNESSYVEVPREINGRQVAVPAYSWGDDMIWGATARILGNFLDVWRAAGVAQPR